MANPYAIDRIRAGPIRPVAAGGAAAAAAAAAARHYGEQLARQAPDYWNQFRDWWDRYEFAQQNRIQPREREHGPFNFDDIRRHFNRVRQRASDVAKRISDWVPKRKGIRGNKSGQVRRAIYKRRGKRRYRRSKKRS